MRLPLRRGEPLLLLALLLGYGWLFVYFERINNPNELVRVYTARALAEHGTYAIGERVEVSPGRFADVGPVYAEWGYVNDKALRCRDAGRSAPSCAGTLYAGKAPGSSWLAVPVVAAQRALTLLVAHRAPAKAELVFSLRLLLVVLPSAVLWLAVRRFLLGHGVASALALSVTLAGAFGSLSLTYGQMFAGHQLSSLALSLAFLAGFRATSTSTSTSTSPSPSTSPTHSLSPFLLGLGCALAVAIEYPAAPAAALLGLGWLLARRPGRRDLLRAALGAALPLALLLHFHTVVFGAPWRTPYSSLENPGFVRDIAPGFMGISLPGWERFEGSLFSPQLGLFFWSPWTLLALLLPLAVLRERRAARRRVGAIRAASAGETGGAAGEAGTAIVGTAIVGTAVDGLGTAVDGLGPAAPLLTACAVVAYYLVFQITHALWRSGWTVGPRYITPLVPFAAVAVGLSAQALPPRARRWALALLGGAGAAAVVATGLASMVCQGFPLDFYNPLVEAVAPLLAHGYAAPNLLQRAGVPGLWSALPSFAVLAAAVVVLLTAPLRDRLAGPSPLSHRAACALAVAVFLALSAVQWGLREPSTPQKEAALRFLAGAWEPNPPPGADPIR